MPAKKTPTKKPVAKKPAVKKVVKNAERKFDQVKKQFEEEADFVKEESKIIASGI